MSITVETDVFCDWCSNWTEGIVAKHERVHQSRAIAREQGWRFRWSPKRRQFEDVCPDCLGKLYAEEINE